MEKQERMFTLTVDKWNSGGMMEKETRLDLETILNKLDIRTLLAYRDFLQCLKVCATAQERLPETQEGVPSEGE